MRHSARLAREAERLATYTEWGAQQYARHLADRERRMAVIYVDYVGPYKRFWVRTADQPRPEGTFKHLEVHPK